MNQPSPELVARWYAKLPPGSDIETPGGYLRADFAARGGARGVETTDAGTPVSSEHDKMGAAFYRMKLRTKRKDMPAWKQRRILKLLAAGVPTRQIMVKVHTGTRPIARLRRQVRAWKDPDDE